MGYYVFLFILYFIRITEISKPDLRYFGNLKDWGCAKCKEQHLSGAVITQYLLLEE